MCICERGFVFVYVCVIMYCLGVRLPQDSSRKDPTSQALISDTLVQASSLSLSLLF